jgi:3-dehydroquinate dehydratase/shikimate dehydrogenase
MKLCLSIGPTTLQEARAKLKQGIHQADLIEIRIDGIRDLNLEKLLQRPRPKVIITNRRKEEGGKFNGSVKEQLNILTKAISLGAEYIDVELSYGPEILRPLLSMKSNTNIIVSYHNYKETPESLEPICKKVIASGAHIIKIATMANDISDNRRMLELVRTVSKSDKKIIGLCMGEYGQMSRILQGIFGGFLTYAAEDEEERTAPGQLIIDDLIKTYPIVNYNRRTKIFGLVGNPVSQSRGVYVHNAIFQRSSVNAVYVNFLVNNLQHFITTYRDLISGMSITMPFKQAILPMLDELEPEVKTLDAVNTVIIRKGKLVGYNTDLPAIADLLQKRTVVRHKDVLILGTGATAKTMAHAVLLHGARTTIMGRSTEKAKALAQQLGCEWAPLSLLPTLHPDILMNGTPVGMSPNNKSSLVPKSLFRKEMIVFDAVYNPPMTPLLLDAEAAGCKIISGLEFFNHQAQLQSNYFMKWTG